MPFHPEDLQAAKDKADRKEAVRHAIGSAHIEGLELADEYKDVLSKWRDGFISDADLDKYVEQIILQTKQSSSTSSHRKSK